MRTKARKSRDDDKVLSRFLGLTESEDMVESDLGYWRERALSAESELEELKTAYHELDQFADEMHQDLRQRDRWER